VGGRSCKKWSPNGIFSFTWHPYARRPNMDYSKEPSTLGRISAWKKTAAGAHCLVLAESGFDKIPSNRRLEAFRKNDGGWTAQMKNIENHGRTNVDSRITAHTRLMRPSSPRWGTPRDWRWLRSFAVVRRSRSLG